VRIFLAVVTAGMVIALASCTRTDSNAPKSGSDSVQAVSTSVEKEYYTCAMHPEIIRDKPGLCPICGMPLIKKSGQHTMSSGELALIRSVSLSPSQRVIANVSTTRAERSSLKKEINTVGVVDFAEPLQAKVTARFRGRIEKLHVNFTGETVHKRQPLFELYSPDLVSAEQELILAVNANHSYSTNGDGENQQRLLQAARDRLRVHFGMTTEQIEEVELRKQARTTLTFNSPIHGTVIRKEIQEGQYVDEGMLLYQLTDLSRVWIYLDVYEKDIRFIKVGKSVQITSEAYPNESFTGKVTFISPVLNGETRTVRVRTEFDNPNGKLKPQMYVKAQVSVPVNDVIVIPSSAVLSTGRRDVVWVEVKPNTFEPRSVMLGVHTESACEVLSGLKEGESIVATGGFMLESESQLQQPFAAGSEPAGGVMTHDDHKASTESKPNEVKIVVNGQFVPDVIHAEKGKTLKLSFYREEESGCINEVVFESLHIRRPLASLKTTTITLTPKKAGEITFTCGMDMVKGKIIVEK